MTGGRERASSNRPSGDEFHARVAALVGERIRRRRRAIDLSQEGLAFRAAVHRTQITLIERGRRLPRIDTLIRLAASLDVSPCQLLAGIDWEPDSEEDATAGERALIARRPGGHTYERPGGPQ